MAIKVSQRVSAINESVTLKQNTKVEKMAAEGKKVFNLTAGQLPFRPSSDFVHHIRDELDFIKSFHYSPVAGFKDLREKIIEYYQESRDLKHNHYLEKFDCVVCNGGKHALSNVLGSLVDHGDEVIVIAPYWVSYPEMIKFCKGVPIVVESSFFNLFTPSVKDIARAISPRTKAIIINSPSNPTGIHYNEEWMREFGGLMLENPHVNIINDEIYYSLYYFDPKPTYFYHFYPELLERTIIVDGVSKILASTGLRLGWIIAPQELVDTVVKLQGQTTSGANSLIQRALLNFEFSKIDEFLHPIKIHLRENSAYLKHAYIANNWSHYWYQPSSAFYYLVDFSNLPIFKKYQQGELDRNDYSFQICEDLLEQKGVSLVPGGAFGIPNSARLSLVLEKVPFQEAINLMMDFFKD